MDIQSLLFGTNEDEFEDVLKLFHVSQESVSENIEKLKKWIKSQPHLYHLDIDPSILKRCLFGKTYSIERAKTRIEKIHIYKARLPQFFSCNINDVNITKMFDAVNICVIPQKLPNTNSRIIIFQIKNPDPETFDVFYVLKVYFMLATLRLKYETHSDALVIIDCKNATLTHFFKILAYINIANVAEECYEDRTKSFYLLNFPEYACHVMSKIKGLLNKRVANKIQLHKNAKILQDVIPIDYLPNDYGGNFKSCREISMQLRDVLNDIKMFEWFSELAKQISNEAERVQDQSLNGGELSGTYGTFGKLEID